MRLWLSSLHDINIFNDLDLIAHTDGGFSICSFCSALPTLLRRVSHKIPTIFLNQSTHWSPSIQAVQQMTGENIELAYVDQGYTGENAVQAADKHGVRLEVVKHTEAKRGFVLLPRRWVVERNFAWAARFRRLARHYERLAKTVAALHYLAFACLMLANMARQLAQS